MSTILIAYRNFVRNGRRFVLLGLAIAGGFFVITVLQGLIGGVTNQINIRGARYYGGHVMILGYQKTPGMAVDRRRGSFSKPCARSGVRPGSSRAECSTETTASCSSTASRWACAGS